jgi:hypothetical protein
MLRTTGLLVQSFVRHGLWEARQPLAECGARPTTPEVVKDDTVIVDNRPSKEGMLVYCNGDHQW